MTPHAPSYDAAARPAPIALSLLRTSLTGFGGALLAASVLLLGGCGGGNDEPEAQKFVQTWETAAVQVNNATLPYFPSVTAQSTQIAVPGVPLSPTIPPPAGTTNTASILSNTTVRQFAT